jgi:hypothetical protein
MKQKAKILLIDIETSPNLSYIWGQYEQNALSIERNWYIMSFSAKWLGGKQITKCLSDYPGYKPLQENDERIMKDIWELLDKAQVVVAHNGDKFDIKKINTRFIKNGMTPPSPYKQIDTLKVAKKYFAFSSNKLDDLGEFLGIGRKLEHEGFPLWQKCMRGEKKSWRKMKRYNVQDTKLLEKVYLELRGWDNRHPNLGLYHEEVVCPKCGSPNIHWRGYQYNRTTKYKRFQCQDCHGWGRSPTREKIIRPLVNV